MDLFAVSVGAAVLGLLHLIGGKLRFLAYIPRSGWLSFAGGVSVAYVFVHLLPEISRGTVVLEEEFGASVWTEFAPWLLAMTGLLIFYGLEVAARRWGHSEEREQGSPAVFWLSMGSYAVYNTLISYLLHERVERGVMNLALFVVAMGLHFVVNDFALRERHKHRYRSTGRWLLLACIALGAGVGAFFRISEPALIAAVAVVAGGVVLNVFKEELPNEADSRFEPLLAGAAFYAGLLLLVG